ncbi:hypothetical protein F2P56_023899 [Juglans regia]|uniref:Protein NIM1-INTERACTING 1-like n=2 Tax=Juglans regia TaxID=51240 RepID=A0A833TYI1_JUGRE|nr:protein NIM1-INTERACTING 3-like [Juglans regia]KAF5454217.1 hypothetical protein F2P56_023899 [Juglans regia]
MEGKGKKRKMDNEEGGGEEEEEEEDEEKKMEKFFALIRSTRDVRDRLRTGVNESKDKEEKRPVEKEIKTTAVWNPKFQPEDFPGEYKPKSSTPGASTPPGPSKREEKEEEEEEEDRGDDKGLDLNLSL